MIIFGFWMPVSIGTFEFAELGDDYPHASLKWSLDQTKYSRSIREYHRMLETTIDREFYKRKVSNIDPIENGKSTG